MKEMEHKNRKKKEEPTINNMAMAGSSAEMTLPWRSADEKTQSSEKQKETHSRHRRVQRPPVGKGG